MNKNSFGQKLKKIRKSKNLTQFELAELAGINEKHVSKIETGVYFPTYTTLCKILSALELSIEDVGLNFENIAAKNDEFFLKSLQILNSAKNLKESEYYFNFLLQAQKNIKLIEKN